MNSSERMLIIEDDRSLYKPLKHIFESEGYAVDFAADGAAGLASVRAAAIPPASSQADPRHVPTRSVDALDGEAAGIEMRAAERVADGMVTGAAIAALHARHVVRDEDPVADAVIAGAHADRRDLAGDLVPEHERRFFNAVPFHDVGAADAARLDAHQELARPDRRHRHLFEPHVAVIVIHRDAHL